MTLLNLLVLEGVDHPCVLKLVMSFLNLLMRDRKWIVPLFTTSHVISEFIYAHERWIVPLSETSNVISEFACARARGGSSLS